MASTEFLVMTSSLPSPVPSLTWHPTLQSKTADSGPAPFAGNR